MNDPGAEELDSPVAIPESIWRKDAKHVLTQIKNHACAEPFLEPGTHRRVDVTSKVLVRTLGMVICCCVLFCSVPSAETDRCCPLRSPPFSSLSTVDPVEHECPDYFKKVKQPMDLGTVTEKFDSYDSPLAFASDVRLTFDNAKTYNPPDHTVYEYAEVPSARALRLCRAMCGADADMAGGARRR